MKTTGRAGWLTAIACFTAAITSLAAHGKDAFPERIELIASDPAPVFRELAEVPLEQKDFSVRFSATVALQPAGQTKAKRTAQRDLNFDAELACVVIRQFDVKGRELAADASLGAARSGNHELSVETAPVPGAVRARLECRLSAMEGQAVFSDFRWAPDASRLFSSALAQRLVADGKSPAVEVNGQILPPLMVHGQNLETSDDATASIDDLALPYQSGLRLFSFNAWFPGVTPQDTTANLETLVTSYPEASFLLRVWLGPRGIFFQDYPDERLSMSDGEHLADMATPTSKVWRRYTEAAVRRFVLSLRKSPAAERIAGIIPMYYVTGEWQLGDPDGPYLPGSQNWRMNGFGEQHRQAFADWAMARYENISGINAAWGTAYADAEDIVVPSVRERLKGSWGNLRDPTKDQRTIDHGHFLSESVSSAIVWSAEAFRRAFDDRVLTGVFYGHMLEHAWSASGVQQQGHLGISRVLASRAIDFQGSPYSYANDSRPRGFPLTANAILESAALHGKAAFLEEDTYTHVAKPPEGFIAPGAHQQTKSLEETLDVLNRNLGTSLARGYIHYWMGLLQDGRFNLPEIWDNYRPVFEWLKQDPQRPAYRPQVALVIDEQSVPYLAEGDRAIVARWLYELRSIIARVDTTLGVYLQSDLERIPEPVRCLILATPYRFSTADEEILQRRWMRDGRSIVFCQFPDVFADQPGRNKAPGQITGIKLEMRDDFAQPVSTITDEGILADFAGQTIGQPEDRAVLFWRPGAKLNEVSPLLCIEDPDVVPLAHYNKVAGQPVSVAMKKMDDWTSIVTGVHSLTPAMWREIIRQANAHLYLDAPAEDFGRPDVIEATSDFVMVISGRDGERTLTLPEPGRLVPLDDGPESSELSRQHRLKFRAGTPRLFRILSK